MTGRSALLLLALLGATGCRPAGPAGTPAPGVVAYLGQGGLWVRALRGGRARRVATGRDLVEPRWSPSGRWLAVRRGDALELVAVDGRGGRTLAAADVDAFAWAHSADFVAYVASGDLHVDAPGGVDRVLVRGAPDGGVNGVAWSPDDRSLAFTRRRVLSPDSAAVAPRGAPAPGSTPRPGPRSGPARPLDPAAAGLWKVHVAGGPPVPVAGPGVAGGEPIVRGWTGDGARILYLRPVGDLRSSSLLADGAPLFAVPAAGGAPVELAAAVLPYQDFVVPAPGGGERVAVVAGRGRETWLDKRLEVVDAATGRGRELTPRGRAAIHPAWSPGGDALAWASMPADSTLPPTDLPSLLGARRILRAPAAGGVAAPLVAAAQAREEAPAWSADGRTLLFVRVDTLGVASLWTVPARGGPAVLRLEGLQPPAGTPAPGWIGAYGHVAWSDVFAWWSRTGG